MEELQARAVAERTLGLGGERWQQFVLEYMYGDERVRQGLVEPGLQAEMATLSLNRWQTVTGTNQYALAA